MNTEQNRQTPDGRDFRTVAMYLPQFHRTPENDRFWGEGFTDWVSAREAVPLFAGHRQPRLPLDDWYYDPTEAATLQRQADLAAEYGIDGFCFYHYWFGDGKKVLHRPAELLLAQKEIAMPFCFCWANDSWARSWTGRDDSNPWADRFETEPESGFYGAGCRPADDGILLRQDYGDWEVWERHFRYLLSFFLDERYITEDGRPVFVVYKAELIPCAKEMLSCWQELAREAGLPGLYLIGANMHRENAVFQASLIHAASQVLPYQKETRKAGIRCFSYRKTWELILEHGPVGRMKTFHDGLVDFDDTPRRGKAGMLVDGASPQRFREYLTALIRKNRIAGSDLVFLNAWNEWGEGNYLEPDTQNGCAWLETIREVLDTREYLTEKEYVLSVFDAAFSAWRDKTILLYGGGANAKAILRTFGAGYHFAGVLDDYTASLRRGDADAESAYLEGVPVLTEEEARAAKPDLMILAAQISSIEPLYRRVCAFCREHGIALYDMYGRDEIALHETARAVRFLGAEGWRRLLAPYELVCIDVNDTLFHAVPGRKRGLFPDLELVRMIRAAAADGKQILFLAEAGLQEEAIEEALRKAGLDEAGALLTEEETGRGKYNGLFRLVALRNPGKRILHIGNDYVYDVLTPGLYGIDGFGYGFVIGEEDYPAAPAAGGGPAHSASGDPEQTEKILMREIRRHAVISFDILDTLIRRRTKDPEDVFLIVQKRAEEEGIFCPELLSARRRAQARRADPTIREIYAELRKCTGITEREAERLLQLEIEAERSILYPVRRMKKLLGFALREGKRVFLTSDMYLPSAVLQDLLDSCGIQGYERIFVSCEYRRRKRDGLFMEIRKAAAGPQAQAGADGCRSAGSGDRQPDRTEAGENGTSCCERTGEILHIGDSFSCDILPARKAGIDAVWIDPESMAEEPEAGSRQWWKAQTEKALVYAETVLAPLMAGYVQWLEEQTAGADGVLFAARDGRIPWRLWERQREQHPEKRLPKGYYFYTSRTAAERAACGRKDVPEEQTNGQEAEPFRELSCADLRDRKGLLRYLNREGLQGEKYVLSDFVSAGTTQKYLQQICPFILTGAYVSIPEEGVLPDVPAAAYIGREEICFQHDFRIMEYLLAAPHPRTDGYERSGEPVFAGEYRSAEELELIRKVQSVVLEKAEMPPGSGILPGSGKEAADAGQQPGGGKEAADTWKREAWRAGCEPQNVPELRPFIVDDRTGRYLYRVPDNHAAETG